jgi:hypothetical protein
VLVSLLVGLVLVALLELIGELVVGSVSEAEFVVVAPKLPVVRLGWM